MIADMIRCVLPLLLLLGFVVHRGLLLPRVAGRYAARVRPSCKGWPGLGVQLAGAPPQRLPRRACTDRWTLDGLRTCGGAFCAARALA